MRRWAGRADIFLGVAGDPILKPKNEKPLEIQVLAILIVSALANFAYGMTIVRTDGRLYGPHEVDRGITG